MKDCTKSKGWKQAKEKSLITQKKQVTQNIENYNKFPKTCVFCDNPIEYSKRYNKFCSKSCAASVNNVKFPKRTAANKHIVAKNKIRTKDAIKIEYDIECIGCGSSFKTFKSTRKYCEAACKSRAEKNRNLELFYNGKKVGHRIARDGLLEKFGAKCQLCGWDEKNVKTNKCPIELDHIDGNSENTTINNVRLLCPNCHSIQPTYKALNKGNGRHSRLQRWKEGKSY